MIPITTTKESIASELHRPARKNFTRRRVILKGKGDLLQADIVEMTSHSVKNRKFKYILTVIDCFTKKAWCFPLKTKTGVEVTAAMEKVLIPHPTTHLMTDSGKEFYNKHFMALMKKYNVNLYSTYSALKASIIERFNRTIKSKMYKQFTAQGSYEWVSILDSLVDTYNNTKHSTIRMTPNQAEANPSSVVIHGRKIPEQKFRFKVGDRVRISMYKTIFTKGYLPSWSSEIFKVVKANPTSPPTYYIEDYTGKPIAGSFYNEELSKTLYPDDYLVEKVLQKKGSKVLVKWLGFDSTHNSWIDKNDLKL